MLLGMGTAPLFADYVRTPEGRLYNGRFSGIATDQYKFDTDSGAVLIPIAGASLHIGVSGVGACVRLYAVKEPDCSGTVFSITPKEILVGYPTAGQSGFVSARLASGSVESISLRKLKGLPHVEPGMAVRLRSGTERLEGSWQLARADVLEILINGAPRELRLKDLSDLTIVTPAPDLPPPEVKDTTPASNGFPFWLWVIPGGPALKRGDVLRGSLLAVSTVAFGVAALREYRSAQALVRDAGRDPVFLYFRFLRVRDYSGEYSQHVVRHQAFSAAALFAFGYHLWDSYHRRTSVPRQDEGATWRFFWEPAATCPELGCQQGRAIGGTGAVQWGITVGVPF